MNKNHQIQLMLTFLHRLHNRIQLINKASIRVQMKNQDIIQNNRTLATLF